MIGALCDPGMLAMWGYAADDHPAWAARWTLYGLELWLGVRVCAIREQLDTASQADCQRCCIL